MPTNPYESAAFETPLPGEKISDLKASVLIAQLERSFRRKVTSRTPANLPLACALDGRKDPHYLGQKQFLSRERVLVWIEGAQLLHEASARDLSSYLERKEPWEDYDICIFDRTMEWCVGINHNGDVYVVE